ncbi:unnamed protein product [Ilex paraguariensis]|uniref:methylmalonate-semialdehyde dehydrogenase (CoA acylating) n=1 Tax=Ilex paraguariensis TaxID=185542 RepID=A0ABC8TWA7_9AQUA
MFLCIYLLFFKAGMYIHARASANGKRVQVCAVHLPPVTGMHFLMTCEQPMVALLSTKLLSCHDWLADCSLQSNIGAKNHAIVMTDARMDATLNALVAAGFGAAGQRCTALSTVVFVGGSKSWYSAISLIYLASSQDGEFVSFFLHSFFLCFLYFLGC